MTKDARAAYSATFSDGRIISGPKPIAGVKGTSITVEEMFYNVPARRAAFRSNGGDEHRAILEVVERYALHHCGRGVGFVCKKVGEQAPDLHVAARTSTVDAIGVVFGTALKRELLPISVSAGQDEGGGSGAAAAGNATASALSAIANAASSSSSSLLQSSSAGAAAGGGDDEEEPLTFSCRGYVSNGSYSQKGRGTFVLFINDRLVDCGPLKWAVEAVYADVLPKGGHPFAYLAVNIPPSHVDVNVHPTKREVAFLHSEALVDAIAGAVSEALRGANASRTFYTQTLLPLAPLTPAGSFTAAADAAAGSSSSPSSSSSGAIDPVASIVRSATDVVLGAAREAGRLGAGAAAFAAAYASSSREHAPQDVQGEGCCCGGGEGGEEDGGEGAGSCAVHSHGEAGAAGEGLDDGEGEGVDSLLPLAGAGAGGGGLALSAGRDGVQARSSDGGAARGGGRGRDGGATDPSVKLRGSRDDDGAGASASSSSSSGGGGWALSYTGAAGGKAGGGKGADGGAAKAGAAAPAKAPSKMVRVDTSHRSLEPYLAPRPGFAGGGGDQSASSAAAGEDEGDDGYAGNGGSGGSDGDGSGEPARRRQPAVITDAEAGGKTSRRAGRVNMIPVSLQSVNDVLAAIEADSHPALASLLPRVTFVGVVDGAQSLVQSNTRLLRIDHVQFAREALYQQAWRLFANMLPFGLAPQPDVGELLELALGHVTAKGRLATPGLGSPGLPQRARALVVDCGGSTRTAADALAQGLLAKGVMLEEYYAIKLRAKKRKAPLVPGGKRKRAGAGGQAGSGRGYRVHPMHAAAAAATAAAPSAAAGGRDDGEPGVFDADTDIDDEEEGGADDEIDDEGEGGGHHAGSGQGEGPRVVLTHLPRLLDGHTPRMAALPDFLLALALDVDYVHERPCFHGIATALADFYAVPPPYVVPPPQQQPAPVTGAAPSPVIVLDDEDGEAGEAGNASSTATATSSGGGGANPTTVELHGPGSLSWHVEHILLPAFRKVLARAPPRKLASGHYVTQLASLEQLYRIFERC